MSNGKVYGIDLGTTYSCIAHVDEHGKPVVVPNAEGDLTTPSVVFFESEDNIVVGQAAKEVASIYTDRCISTVKRSMGNSAWEREFFGQTYKPQDVSSFILRKLVNDAQAITGDEIKDVVVTCPAYFGVNEKEATKQAGIVAGLNVLYVIPEPTAAALAYGIEQDDDQVIMVYDLGGGTFDVTLIEIKGGAITVICTGGDHELGGKDWDEAIVTYFAERFQEETGTSADDLLDDEETYQELLNAAENHKKGLSSRQSIVQGVRFGADRARVELTRERFDEITSSYLERTIMLTEQELEKAKSKGFERIDKLLLVGGSTYMPQVMEKVESEFDFEILQFDPNQAVAKGAALFGYKYQLEEDLKGIIASATGQSAEDVDLEKTDAKALAKAQEEVAVEAGLSLAGVKSITEKKITNVASKSFGVKVMNEEHREVATNLIEMDSKVPADITRKFGTYEEGQIQVDVVCLENKVTGESSFELDRCNRLGQAELKFQKPLPKGSPIEITFTLKADGLLEISGRDLETGGEFETTFQTEAVMSKEEIEASKNRNLALKVA